MNEVVIQGDAPECELDGADQTVLVLRCSGPGGQSYGGFRWPTSGPVEAPDWGPTPTCGHGLHGWLWGEGDAEASPWHDAIGAVWQVVEVDASDIVPLNGKVKFPRGVVVRSGPRADVVAWMVDRCPGRAVVYGVVTAGDHGPATVGAYGTATAGYYGTATAGYYGTATAGVNGTATAGDYGTARAGDGGTATAGEHGTAVAGYHGTARAGARGTATAGANGTATAGHYGTAAVGIGGIASVGDGGTATAGIGGTARAGENGTATAGEHGTAVAGYHGTAIAGIGGTAIAGHGGRAQAGLYGAIRIVVGGGRVITASVDGVDVLADVMYRVSEGGALEGDTP